MPSRFLRRLASLLRFERDMTDELRDHLERRTADLKRTGLSPDEARRRAGVEFGAVEAYKEVLRESRPFATIREIPPQLGRELRFAVRRLCATPLFTLFAILSLAVGVGVTTAIFSVMHAMLWRSHGVEQPHELVNVAIPSDGRMQQSFVLSHADFEDLEASARSFVSLSASSAMQQPVISSDVADFVRVEAVSGNYFPAIGVSAAVGRVLTANDDRPDAPPVAVLGDSFWRTKLGADPAILGRVVKVGGVACTVVGVTPASFRGLTELSNFMPTPVWVPIATATAMTAGLPPQSDRTRRAFTAVGRLAPGSSLETASAELAAIGTTLDAAFPRAAAAGTDERSAKRTWSAMPLRSGSPGGGQETPIAAFIIGLAALVLVVACTNLANLAIARGGARRREFAVRRALGASRFRLVREQLVEHTIVAMAGAAGALLVTQTLMVVLQSQLPTGSGLPIDLDLRLQPAIIVAALTSSALSLLVFGVWPAWRLAGAVPRVAMAATAGAMESLRWRPRRALIACQVAVSVALFLVAVQAVRGVIATAQHQNGVDVDRLAILMVDFGTQRWDEARARRAIEAITQDAVQQPGVARMTVTTGLPFSAVRPAPYVEIGTGERPFGVAGREADGAYLLAATPGIFDTLGVAITHGRGFDDRDNAASRPVVVVSDRVARMLFRTADVVERKLLVGMPARLGASAAPAPTVATIIGVASDTNTAWAGMERDRTVYMPITQRFGSFVHVVARTDGDPASVVTSLRSVVRRAEPDLAIMAAATGPVIMTPHLIMNRAAAVVASGLGVIAMALAMAGLYGVLSQLVQSRTREIGIRIAIGADPGRVRRLILREGFRPVIVGLAMAIVIGLIARGLTRASVLGLGSGVIDPIGFTAAALPLAIAAFAACYLPARRAARVNPTVALREL